MKEKTATIARTAPSRPGYSMAGGPMDTYIVRVYRRKGEHPERISGHVIKIEVKDRHEFFDSEMLRNILEPISPDMQPKAPFLRSGSRGGMSMADLVRAIVEEEKL